MQKLFPNERLGRKISKWYLLHGRHDLPWRKSISPYRVWISEIMLQQTQVVTAIPFFKRFMRQYPTLKSFLGASEDEVLALWSGLGYYRRARYIFQTKEIIKSLYKGKFPKDFDSILSLPGIGRSTAGAIASIVHNQPFPILDTNVKRVLQRLHALPDSINDKLMWELATHIQDRKDLFPYTQGIMDLGATVCLTKEPLCKKCPLKKDCKSAFQLNTQISPRKIIQKKKMALKFYLFLDNEQFLAQKNNELSIWSGLWLLPPEIPINFVNKYTVSRDFTVMHQLSHRTLEITFVVCKMKRLLRPKTNHEYKTVKINSYFDLGMPKPITQLIKNL